MPDLVLLLALTFTPLPPPSPGHEAGAEFHVSALGNDAWDGSAPEHAGDGKTGPFATLGRAQRAVREYLAETGSKATHTVQIGGGWYELEDTLVFGPEDSNAEPGPIEVHDGSLYPGFVFWQAREGEHVVVSGGRRLTGWTVEEDGRWTLELPEVRGGTWNFSQLWVNGERRFRPRVPSTGWFKVAEELPPSEKAAGKGHDRLGYAEGDFSPEWNLDEVELFGVHIWSASRMRIAENDVEKRTLTFTGPTRTTARWAAFLEGNRYFVDNVRQALDQPGEWFLDRKTGVLTYLPRPGETPETVTVVAPRLDTLVRFEGRVEEGQPAGGIQFLAVDFAHTGWNLAPQGQSFPQAEVQLGGAIELVGAHGVMLEFCTVRHTGGYGVAIGPGCRKAWVHGCDLFDLGGGGVKVGTASGAQLVSFGGFDPENPENAVDRNWVTDCRIRGGGRLHPAAVGVWIGHATNTLVERNEIGDFYYTGVSVGWTWGYAEPSRSHHNEIAWNHIHDIGQGVLSDMAGVYTLGVSPGTKVHHNIIEDVHAYDYGGWGLYTDEGSTWIEMTHNLVVRTKTGGFHQHYGKDNRIAHNVFAEAEVQQLQRTRTEEHRSFRFVYNVVYWTNESPLFGSNWRDDHFMVDGNLYWNPNYPEIVFPGGLDLEGWRARGHDRNSMIADPKFVDPAGGDWRFAEDSRVGRWGASWDHSKAGPRDLDLYPREIPPIPAGFTTSSKEGR